MDKFLTLFDYFKEAYRLNINNKKLYRPQILLICFKLLMIVILGIRVYGWVNDIEMYANDPHMFLRVLVTDGLILLVLFLAYAIISVIIESGLYNMYKVCITTGSTDFPDFWEGVQKYFVRMLFGSLLVLLGYIILLPFYLLIGVITLTAGLSILAIIAGVFLTMWKISLVMNDSGIVKAIKDSFRFAYNNFLPLTLLQLIHWAFAAGPKSSGSYFNYSGNSSDLASIFSNNVDPYYAQEGIEFLAGFLKIIVIILIPVITIATLVASLIRMLFEVFFSLVLFIVYNRKFINEDEKSEVCPDEDDCCCDCECDTKEAELSSEQKEEVL
ncbi:MAG: hypothetical protein ACOZCL_01280 [Bacillota bacterium]